MRRGEIIAGMDRVDDGFGRQDEGVVALIRDIDQPADA